MSIYFHSVKKTEGDTHERFKCLLNYLNNCFQLGSLQCYLKTLDLDQFSVLVCPIVVNMILQKA